MPDARDHLDRLESARAPHQDPGAGPGRAPAPPILRAGDPRLRGGGHAAAASGLLALQRTAGNAAVASLIAPSVQRDGPEPAPEAGGTSGAPGGTGATGAGGATEITGSTIQLNAPMVTAPGVIQADTIIANSVVASSYTPGAGNEW